MSRFVTLFRYDLEPVHLFKDVGQIPITFSRWGYQSRIVGFWKTKPDHPAAEQISRMRPNSRKLRTLWLLFYILLHAKRIAVLNLYFWGKDTFLLGSLYKLLNPDGFLYVKTDVIPGLIRQEDPRGLALRLRSHFIRIVNAVSVETRRANDLFKELFPELGTKLLYVPNGVDPDLLGSPPHGDKENIILSVGSIGQPVKNHELLVSGFLALNLPGWKLVLVGPVSNPFREWIKNHPEDPLGSGRVVLRGPTTSREELAQWYRRARVFCLSSRYESYGIALLESLCFGACAVGSDTIESIEDFSNATGMVEVFKTGDSESLEKALKKAIARSEKDSDFLQRQAIKVRDQYDWSRLLSPIRESLSSKTHSLR